MRRRTSTEPTSNHERWLVSYADFITLLFAFFVVLYAAAEFDKKKAVELSAAIEGAFQQMGVLSDPAARAPVPAPQPAAETPAVKAGPPTDPSGAMRSRTIDANALRRELEVVLGSEIRQHEIQVRETPEGLVLSLREVGFFNSGRALLLDDALPKLARIAQVLNHHGFDIRVEGHTDDIPIHTQEFHSNWALSAARATQVVTLLVENYRLDPVRVSIAGYGPYRPIAENGTAEGRRMNRRVDLVITSSSLTPSTKDSPVPAGVNAGDAETADEVIAGQ